MRFLSAEESKKLEKKARNQLGNVEQPKCVLYYGNDYSRAAQLISAAVGDFNEAAVLFQFAISGDGWAEHNLPDRRWQAYRKWRSSMGEPRRLYDAPGHLFERSESDHFSRLLEFALTLGWDAVVTAKPKRNFLLLSHDDRLEIFAGFDRHNLARKLLKLGYWSE